MAEVDRKWIESALQKGVKEFPDMDLSRLDLSYLDFTGCNLHGCNLEGTDLTGSTLDKSDLTWANLNGAIVDSIKATNVQLYKAKGKEILTASKACTEDTTLDDIQVKDSSLDIN
jgi:uncharacterized protein YjbI with pentapeptide repeats